MEESDEELADAGEKINIEEEEEEVEDEIIESDIELEGDMVEPDNESPQKVLSYFPISFCFNFFKLISHCVVFGVRRWETLRWRLPMITVMLPIQLRPKLWMPFLKVNTHNLLFIYLFSFV